MKRNMTKVISVIVVLVMAAALAGCSDARSEVLGTWKADVNLAEFINQEMAAADESVAEYLSVDSFYLTMVLDFKENNTYSISLDESNLDATMEKFKQDVRSGMERYLVDMMADMGLEMTVDEIMEASGTSMEELLEQACTDEMMQQIVDSAKSEGKFKVKDGKMYLSAGLDYEVDESIYGNYIIDGGKLTLVDYSGEEDEFLGLYPLTFTKAG
ncbi:MAG: hypothetical protein ACI3V5_09395 [Faecousia sp.]